VLHSNELTPHLGGRVDDALEVLVGHAGRSVLALILDVLDGHLAVEVFEVILACVRVYRLWEVEGHDGERGVGL
jgi:maltooligosyltrehalose synthase